MAQQKGVLNNHRLLFNTIGGQRLSRFQSVRVAAEGVPAQDQIPVATGLCLPNVRELVDQEALPKEFFARKIVAVGAAVGVEVDVPARGHRHFARLERKPLSAA